MHRTEDIGVKVIVVGGVRGEKPRRATRWKTLYRNGPSTIGGLPSRNVLRPAPGRIAAEVCDRSPCRRTTGIHWLPNERVVTKRKIQRNPAPRAGDQGNSEIRVQVLVVYAIEPARTERAERWNASVLGSGLGRKAIGV